MEDPKKLPEPSPFSSEGGSGLSRREFLKAAAIGAVAASSLEGWCGGTAALAAPEAVGYPLNFSPKGVRCYPTESEAAGYDPEVFYEADPPGKLSPSDLEYGKGTESRCSYFSRIVTRQITALITVPVIKDALQAGVTLSLKNLAFGTIDNTPRFHPPEILCDPVIAEVCAHPVLRQRAVLHVLDGLHAQYDKGPSPDPRYVWKHNGLLFSTDPVALDQVGMEIIEAKRQQEGLPPLAKVGRPAKHIATAARLGLGTNDRGKIEEVKRVGGVNGGYPADRGHQSGRTWRRPSGAGSSARTSSIA